MRKSLGSDGPQTTAALCSCLTQRLLAVLLKGIEQTHKPFTDSLPTWEFFALFWVLALHQFPKVYSCEGLPLLYDLSKCHPNKALSVLLPSHNYFLPPPCPPITLRSSNSPPFHSVQPKLREGITQGHEHQEVGSLGAVFSVNNNLPSGP